LARHREIKNSPNFYQEAPFLTIAEDLLKLIKEDKVEQIIFLSAYDKKKFPNEDPRKLEIFKQTLGSVCANFSTITKTSGEAFCYLQLIGFDNENQGQSKAD